MAKENELLSLGGQAAAAAHSLSTPLSTILLTTKELQKEFGENSSVQVKKYIDVYRKGNISRLRYIKRYISRDRE